MKMKYEVRRRAIGLLLVEDGEEIACLSDEEAGDLFAELARELGYELQTVDVPVESSEPPPAGTDEGSGTTLK